MKKYTVFLIVALYLATSSAIAEDMDFRGNWTVPDPVEYMSHIGELCKHESLSALYIANKRDSGMPKEFALGEKPVELPAGYRLSEVVLENIDDLYSYTDINALTYYAFRGRECTLEKAQGKPKIKFSEVYEQIKKCQIEAKVNSTDKLTNVSSSSKTTIKQCVFNLLK